MDLHGGREHVITLRADGTVWTWGSNQHGQLGTGGTTNRSTPARVPGLSGIVAVETGHNHSVALGSDGRVWTWGYNADGQLGDGTTTGRRTPVQVAGLTDATAIAAGRDMAYAIRADGTVVGWGRNDEGQLGDGTSTRRLTPVRIGALTDVTAIAAGRDHGLAVRSDGSVWAWGSNNYGQLGLGSAGSTTDRLAPAQVVASGIVEVAAGAHHSLARAASGQVWSWGRNYRANLGDGSTTQRTRPVQVRGVSTAISIASGRDHGLAVLADGRAMTWGENSSGQLGDGTTIRRPVAIVVPGVSGAVQAGGGGAAYTVALVADGQAPTNLPPVANIAHTCDLSACDFSGAGSTDPDGQVAGYAWTFDGTDTDTGVSASRTLPAGDHIVSLTVTDADGATATTSTAFTVRDSTVPADVAFVGQTSQNSNTTAPTVTVPTDVLPGDRLLLVVTVNRASTLTVPAGWSQVATASDGTDVRSWVLTRTAMAGTAGTQVRSSLDSTSKTATHLLAYRGAGTPVASGHAEPGTTALHAAPAVEVPTAGSTVLWAWIDKVSTPHAWVLPSAATTRASTQGSGGGLLTSVVGDRAGVPTGPLSALSADAGVAASKAVAWTVVLPPQP